MKYYIGNIDEQYGEFEVEQSFLFATYAELKDKRVFTEIYSDEEPKQENVKDNDRGVA